MHLGYGAGADPGAENLGSGLAKLQTCKRGVATSGAPVLLRLAPFLAPHSPRHSVSSWKHRSASSINANWLGPGRSIPVFLSTTSFAASASSLIATTLQSPTCRQRCPCLPPRPKPRGLHWKEWARWSARQKAEIIFGGLVGTVALDTCDLVPFWPLLRAGQLFHAANEVTFGLGRYRIEPI